MVREASLGLGSRYLSFVEKKKTYALPFTAASSLDHFSSPLRGLTTKWIAYILTSLFVGYVRTLVVATLSRRYLQQTWRRNVSVGYLYLAACVYPDWWGKVDKMPGFSFVSTEVVNSELSIDALRYLRTVVSVFETALCQVPGVPE